MDDQQVVSSLEAGTVRPVMPSERAGVEADSEAWQRAEQADATRAEEYLDVLEEYRVSCERQGRYAEAGRTVDQIAAVRSEEEARRITNLKSRHADERAALAAAHQLQYDEFVAQWETYLDGFDTAAAEHMRLFRERHIVELKEYQDAAHGDLLRTPLKFSRELLLWRSREQSLAKQRKYTDAAQIKAVTDDMERKERSKWDSERLASHAGREQRFLAQQEAELSAAMDRIARRRADHVKLRDGDALRLLQRNRNVLKTLEHRHIAEEEKFVAAVRIALAPKARRVERKALCSGSPSRDRSPGVSSLDC